jgi:hypothetical protein
VDAVKILVAAESGRQSEQCRRQDQPDADRRDQRPLSISPKWLLDQGANPNAASENGVTPLYAALNVTWAPRALYPQPRAFNQQQITYLDFMKALLDKGADPNTRLTKKVWYSEYNFDLAGVDEVGATPFWRAASRATCRRCSCCSITAPIPTSRRCVRPAVVRSVTPARRASRRMCPASR